MKDINKAVELAVNIANNPNHGYDQVNRLGPDFDCSSFIAHCLAENGFKVYRSSWTGNLAAQLKANGFVEAIGPWRKGDIHLTPGKHVAMSVDANTIVHARINELGKISGGKPGDQTGNEIAVTPYYDYPWKHHFRYIVKTGESKWDVAEAVIAGKYGNYPERRTLLEADGYDYGEIQDMVNAIVIAKDVVKGKYGNNPERAKRLEQLGYNPALVQEYVNIMLGVING